jgi:mono/diheme cytochrome c family protein
MNDVCRSLWTGRRLRASVGPLVLAVLAGCGGEQRSGAVPADSARPAVNDSSVGIPNDSRATPAQDTAVARAESTRTRSDTAKAIATKPTPGTASPKTAAPKASTPRPAASPKPRTPARTDSSAPARATPPSPAQNSATTAQPADTASGTQTAQANAPLRDPYHQAPLDTVPQQVYDGWKQFNLNCARCHGEDAQGTTIAPHLIVSLRPDGPINTKELFVQTVCAGRPAKGMPSWCALGMEMPTIEAIYSYVKGRSDSKIHPGRPAVRSGG